MSNPTTSLDAVSQRLLGTAFRDLSVEKQRVIEQLVRRSVTARNAPAILSEEKTFGQRLADRVAAVGGSWGFIIGFAVVLVIWVAGNSLLLIDLGLRPFDPYPYIFLNLLLSMLAALQAPVIMMSQNRQAAKDRIAAEHDYEINLKAELEIMGLHEKLDGLRSSELAELLAQQIILLKALRDDASSRRGAREPPVA